MKYKIFTFLLIITLTLGFLQINTKAANGVNNLDITWSTFSNDIGVYQYGLIESILPQYNSNFTGIVYNDDDPMIIHAYMDTADVGTWTLFPNEYLIQQTIISGTERNITLYTGDPIPANLIFDINYDLDNEDFYIEFIYYTSGIAKNYWDMALTMAGSYEGAYSAGYQMGKEETKGIYESMIVEIEAEFYGYGYDSGFNNGYNDGVSDTYQPAYNEGFEAGADFDAFGWLKSTIYFIGWIFNVQFIPGISLGRIAMLILFIYLIPFILKMFGGKD